MEWKCSHPIEKLFIFLCQIPIAKKVNLNVCEPIFICRQELKSLSIGSHILEETHARSLGLYLYLFTVSISVSESGSARGFFPFLGHCRFMLAKEGSVGFLCHCTKHLETPLAGIFGFINKS